MLGSGATPAGLIDSAASAESECCPGPRSWAAAVPPPPGACGRGEWRGAGANPGGRELGCGQDSSASTGST